MRRIFFLSNWILCSSSKSHGSVALSNVPGPSSMMMPDESYNENIPNLSFSLNPSMQKETKTKEEVAPEEYRE